MIPRYSRDSLNTSATQTTTNSPDILRPMQLNMYREPTCKRKGLADYNLSDDEDYVPDDDVNSETNDEVSLQGPHLKLTVKVIC